METRFGNNKVIIEEEEEEKNDKSDLDFVSQTDNVKENTLQEHRPTEINGTSPHINANDKDNKSDNEIPTVTQTKIDSPEPPVSDLPQLKVENIDEKSDELENPLSDKGHDEHEVHENDEVDSVDKEKKEHTEHGQHQADIEDKVDALDVDDKSDEKVEEAKDTIEVIITPNENENIDQSPAEVEPTPPADKSELIVEPTSPHDGEDLVPTELVEEKEPYELVDMAQYLTPDDNSEEDEDRLVDDGDLHEQYEEEELLIQRERIIIEHKEATAERKQLREINANLQSKLAEYFRKKKADTTDSATAGSYNKDDGKTTAEQEQRYMRCIINLDELKNQYTTKKQEFQEEIERLREDCRTRSLLVDECTTAFSSFKEQIASKAVNSRTGKKLPSKELRELLDNERKKESEVVAVRLENIKLTNKLRKEEHVLKSKEDIAEGLHLIDFEQLKIENQTFNEKIEERNEDLAKLRRKITSTVQILAHIKEKLQFVEQEKTFLHEKLISVDDILKELRDKLTRTKLIRDGLRIETYKAKQRCGLLGNELLLRNYENCVNQVEAKKEHLQNMRREHAELTLRTRGTVKKIEKTNPSQLTNA